VEGDMKFLFLIFTIFIISCGQEIPGRDALMTFQESDGSGFYQYPENTNTGGDNTNPVNNYPDPNNDLPDKIDERQDDPNNNSGNTDLGGGSLTCAQGGGQFACSITEGGGQGYRQGDCNTNTGAWVDNSSASCVLTNCMHDNYSVSGDKLSCVLSDISVSCSCNVLGKNDYRLAVTFQAKDIAGVRSIKVSSNQGVNPTSGCGSWANKTSVSCGISYYSTVANMSISGSGENMSISGNANSSFKYSCTCTKSYGSDAVIQNFGPDYCPVNGTTKSDSWCNYSCINNKWVQQSCPGGS
jgi:hypothetical protein